MSRRYVADPTVNPPIFLPAEIYEKRHDMMDVTSGMNLYRVYIDKEGNRHDGAEYKREAVARLNAKRS